MTGKQRGQVAREMTEQGRLLALEEEGQAAVVRTGMAEMDRLMREGMPGIERADGRGQQSVLQRREGTMDPDSVS